MADTMTDVASVGVVEVNQTYADEFFVQYSAVKSLLDLAVRQDDPRGWLESKIDEVCETIAKARHGVKDGKGLTLKQSQGFGSDSFSAICASIINERANNAKLKSTAGKVGREITKLAKS